MEHHYEQDSNESDSDSEDRENVSPISINKSQKREGSIVKI